MGKWISVKERIPEKELDEKIVWIPKKQDVDQGCIMNGKWFTPYLFNGVVTHWMDFPPLEEWNRIEDGLPKELGWYFTLNPKNKPTIDKTICTTLDFIYWDDLDVWTRKDFVYWMPLPEPPEED